MSEKAELEKEIKFTREKSTKEETYYKELKQMVEKEATLMKDERVNYLTKVDITKRVTILYIYIYIYYRWKLTARVS